MPRTSHKPNPSPDIKVFIRNGRGEYLAGDANNWFFTDDRSSALVLNYRADRVPEQLEALRKVQGIALAADPVALIEIYEACDRCKELFIPAMIFFDGSRFLCADCQPRRSKRA